MKKNSNLKKKKKIDKFFLLENWNYQNSSFRETKIWDSINWPIKWFYYKIFLFYLFVDLSWQKIYNEIFVYNKAAML